MSHLPERQEGYGNVFWLPEKEGDPIPLAVRQMRLMTAAPKLLAMLKIAVATADPAKHKWVKEAQDAIAEATGQPFDAKEAEAARHMHRAAPRMYAALKVCEKTVKHFQGWLYYVDEFLHQQDEKSHKDIDDVLQEAHTAIAEADGEILF